MKKDIEKLSRHKLLPEIKNYIHNLFQEEENISIERKKVLKQIAEYIQNRVSSRKQTNLMFICTHNSRRSHMGQLWALTASVFFGIPNVNCYSGGTEVTALNVRSVRALQKVGFKIWQASEEENSLYNTRYYTKPEHIMMFSKHYSHESNPQNNFAAIMTCSDADEDCPVVFGADTRFSLQYEDPKIADDTEQEEKVYDERCKQIATEMLYMLSKVK